MHKVISVFVASILLVSLVLPASADHVVTNEQEPNDVPGQANPARMGNGVTGDAPLGDVDYFKVETPERLAAYAAHVQIYTPHPPLNCVVTVAIRSSIGPNQITYESQEIDYEARWTGLTPEYYVGISSTCEDLHYQIDFIRIHGPYQTYLPLVIR